MSLNSIDSIDSTRPSVETGTAASLVERNKLDMEEKDLSSNHIGLADESSPSRTRTTGSQPHPAQPSCRQCGRPVEGRRRNGFCSDRCRMAVRRKEQAARIDELLTRIEESVTALRGELESE